MSAGKGAANNGDSAASQDNAEDSNSQGQWQPPVSISSRRRTVLALHAMFSIFEAP